MTHDDERLRKLAGKATPGPWGGEHVGLDRTGGYIGHSGYGRQVMLWTRDEKGPLVTDTICICETGLHGNDEANAAYIAAASPERILDLLRRLDLWQKYAKLLGDELTEIIPYMVNHGWHSTRYEEGKRLRGLLGIEEDE